MALLPHHISNNRPIQNVNDRVVRYFSGIKPDIPVDELGVQYEKCELNDLVPPSEKRNNWNNMTLSLNLEPGQTEYLAIQIYDIPVTPSVDINYIRVTLDDLSKNSVLIRMRQIHVTSKIQTKSAFFFLTRYQRQQFYQIWLPGEEPHDNDMTYPPDQEVKECSNDFNCGYVLPNPVMDQTDVLLVFMVSIQNTGSTTISTKVSAFAGDKTPHCRIAPIGIILGSLWIATIVAIIVATVVILAWENAVLAKQAASK
jgi:hypothetical protein